VSLLLVLKHVRRVHFIDHVWHRRRFSTPTISYVSRVVILFLWNVQSWLVLLKLIRSLQQLRYRDLKKILQSKCVPDLLLLIEVVQDVVLRVALELRHVILKYNTQDLFGRRHIGSDNRTGEVTIEAQDIEAF